MNIHTMSENAKVASGFVLTITAAAVNGSAVDCKGYTRAMAIFTSTPSGAGTTSDCKLQEDDNSGFTSAADVSGGTFAQVTTAGGHSLQVMNIDLEKRERYLRLVHTGVGASAAGAAAGVIVLFRGRRTQAQEATAISV